MLLHMDSVILMESANLQSGNACSTVMCNKNDVILLLFTIIFMQLYHFLYYWIITGDYWAY